METVFTWTISSMESQIIQGDLANVVVIVHWRLMGERDGFTAESYSAISLPSPTGEDFTPYSALTKDQVVGWVETALSVQPPTEEGQEPQQTQLEIIKEGINNRLDTLINPIIETLPLPFTTS